jgi:hypothetical protein
MVVENLKRYSVKYIRDGAKSAYKKDDHCHICETDQDLQLHHYTGLADLWAMWCRKNRIKINTVDDVMEHREHFIAQHYDQLYHEVVTLCKPHHADLHVMFGKAPAIGSSKAQARWIEIKRKKWLEKQS